MPGARPNMQFYCGFTPGLARICSFTAVSPRGWQEYAFSLRLYPGAGKNMQFHCGFTPGLARIYAVSLRKMPERICSFTAENAQGPGPERKYLGPERMCRCSALNALATGPKRLLCQTLQVEAFSWQVLVAHVDSWRLLVASGGSWWFLMAPGDSWWFLVALAPGVSCWTKKASM